MSIKLGNSAKDSGYLKRMKRAIERDLSHPRHHGIKMQAHHLISASAMKESGLGSKVVRFGYDINHYNNLAFLPCTLQGACHLGVQPHRGNHDTPIVDEDDYIDDNEPRNYHEKVAFMIKGLHMPLSKECPGADHNKGKKVQDELNKLSSKILLFIQEKPAVAPLTKIAKHFAKGGVGCSGVDSVGSHRHTRSCPVGRNHLFDPGVPSKSQCAELNQKEERITYRFVGDYKLKVGR